MKRLSIACFVVHVVGVASLSQISAKRNAVRLQTTTTLQAPEGTDHMTDRSLSRRHWFTQLIRNTGVVSAGILSTNAITTTTPAVAAADPRKNIVLHLESPQVKAGLELMDVTIGSPPRVVPAIRRVFPQVGVARNNPLMVPGLVLRDYASSAEVVERMMQGPYPLDLVFENLAAGGDAFGELQKPLVTAEDALELSAKTSSPLPSTPSANNRNEYMVRDITTASPSATMCNLKSRKGDVLEIRYEAYLSGPDGPMYDASEQRGTGLPYQMVLGSGDMLPGVDQGLYDMCPGDIRALGIPPPLAYGYKGNRLYGIPPNTRLYWTVELVSVNSVRAGDGRSREEMEGREL